MQENRYQLAFMTLLLTGFVFLYGCDGTSSNAEQNEQNSTQDKLSASEILETSIQQYEDAKSYSDNGVLYLTYRINGRWIQEPQPFSTAWTDGGKFAANLFNARIRCDGQQLSCYVFDIQSGNLDNQHLLIPAQAKIPLHEVFSDKIASHFVQGFSEFPLDELHRHDRPALIPLAVGLLTEESVASWIYHPAQLTRMPDEVLEELPCFVLQITDPSGIYRIWIDQQSGIIHQLELPLDYLDTKVLSATEITDLTFLARFHQAQLNGSVPSDTFAVKNRIGSTLVRHFVELPEPFPCEMIGQTAPEFQLFTPDDKTVERSHFAGKVAALFWLGDIGATETIKQLDQLMGKFDRERFEFSVIYSDAELADPGSKSNDMKSELKQFVTREAIRTEFFCDRNLNASTKLKLKSIPSVIVIDSESKIQFAVTTADENWSENLSAAMNRVAAGENVAAEMKADYQAFLETYHQQLLAASTSFNGLHASGTADTDPPAKAPSPTLTPSRRWINTQLVQPGNWITTGRSGQVFVLDGWQTIVQLDWQGNVIHRTELDLPDGQAINQIRSFTDSTGKTLFAGFSMLGKYAFVFDADWNLLAQFPDGPENHRGISDCLLGDFDTDANVELVVSFADQNGIQQFELASSRSQQLFKSPVKSLAYHARQLLAIVEGEIVDVQSGQKLPGYVNYRTLYSIGAGGHALALGLREHGSWQLTGLNSDPRQHWTVNIGSQFFENEIAPIVDLGGSEYRLIAVADADGCIKLFSTNGESLGIVKFKESLHGLTLLNVDQNILLMVSLDKAVECWHLERTGQTAIPVSGEQRFDARKAFRAD